MGDGDDMDNTWYSIPVVLWYTTYTLVYLVYKIK